jgi:hypothetical protein
MAQDYVDDSNPFDRSGDTIDTERHFGTKGRDIELSSDIEGVVEGISGTVAKGLNTSDPWKTADLN